MQFRHILLVILVMLSATSSLKAQHSFIENGGQWNEHVEYRADISGGDFYLEKDRFTFNFFDQEAVSALFSMHTGSTTNFNPQENLKCHAYQVVFKNSSDVVSFRPRKTQKGTYNFFTDKNPENWASNLRAHEEILYENLYSGIDLKVYTSTNLKYDFIVKPGADAQTIRLAYEGVKPKLLKDGRIELKTSLGIIFESKPFAYQLIEGSITTVECAYEIKGNEVGFKLGDYNMSEPLIIDPELIFSTYSGSFADNFGYTATYDNEGHLYSGSTVFGIGYPTTIGAYQLDWANSSAGTDMGITKFSLDGTELLYSTYLGGAASELPHSLIADDNGELYIFGTSGSDNFPVTTDAFQTDFNGGPQRFLSGLGVILPNGSDIVVSRLSSDGGELLGSSYLGGTDNDGLNTFNIGLVDPNNPAASDAIVGSDSLRYNYADEIRGEIELDPEGNVVVGTCTWSDDFPTTTGSFQNQKAGFKDGVIFRFNPTMSNLIHSSYYGGSGDDAVYSINVSQEGEITAAGGTNSLDLEASANAYQASFAGGTTDGFVVVMNEEIESVQHMTYFGSDSYEQIYFVDLDPEGSPHVYGQTEASDDTFIINAAYSTSNAGMLLAKFSPDLMNLEWSTVFGTGNGIPSLSPTAFAVDICNRTYLAGWGGQVNNQGTTTGLEVTSDALKSDTDGSDFYIAVIEGDASALAFASFYGGDESAEHVDGGTSRFDRGGKIYQAVCAGCGSNDDFPIAPENAWSSLNNSSNCNLGVAKINLDLPLVVADFSAEPICLPDSVQFINQSQTSTQSNPSYEWNFPEGPPSFEENPSFLFSEPGTYEVTLISFDPFSCNLSDTITQTIEVFSELFLEIPDSVISCTDTEFDLIAETNNTANFFQWASDPEFNDILSTGPVDSIFTYTSETTATLYLAVSNGFCSDTASVFVAPAPSVSLSIGDTLLCNETEASVEAIISGDYEVDNALWTPENSILSGQSSTSVEIAVGGLTTLTAQLTNQFGCTAEASIEIEAYDIELQELTDTLTCKGTEIDLIANSNGTAEGFIWSENPNLTPPLNALEDSVITVLSDDFTYYFIQVNNNGCNLIDSVGIGVFNQGISVSPDQFVCFGDTVSLQVFNTAPGNEVKFSWQPEEFILSGQGTDEIRVIATETITFQVTSTSPQGCTVETETTIFVSNLTEGPVEAIADPEIILNGQSTDLSGLPDNPAYSYQWTPAGDVSNPNAQFTDAIPSTSTTFFLSISDFSDLGICSRSDSVRVTVLEFVCGDPFIFVPNAFTPNGDGENDQVLVRGQNITDLYFAVYNRWGEIVFETRNQSLGWDGTYEGEPVAPAVFKYLLEVRCLDGEQYFDKGNITLIR